MNLNFSSRKRKTILLSAIYSVLLLFAGYFVNNLPLFTGEDLNHFFITQVICEKLGISHNINCDDAFFVNVSNDKQIAYSIDEDRDTIGTTAVTDRNKLFQFLNILKTHPTYKYIIVDLRFDKHDVTEIDSQLYDLISNMDNIVIVRDDKISLPNKEMFNKSAYADYYSTITATNFTRFQFLNSKGDRYIPLKVYEDLNPSEKIRSHGFSWIPVYTSGDALCQRSSFILFDRNQITSFGAANSEDISELKLSEGENSEPQTYFNLGKDLLENAELDSDEEKIQDIIDKADGAYVVIGNFTEDLHDTYMGMKPGPYILYRALKTLESHSYKVEFFFIIYWFLIYAVIFYFIISQKHILNLFVKIKNNRYNFFYFVVDMLGYSTILFIFATIEYVATNTINSLVLPIIVFSIIKLINNYKKFNLA
jgi:hypothetical protein